MCLMLMFIILQVYCCINYMYFFSFFLSSYVSNVDVYYTTSMQVSLIFQIIIPQVGIIIACRHI